MLWSISNWLYEKWKKYYGCLNYSKYRKLRCTYHTIDEQYILENFKLFLRNAKENVKAVKQVIDYFDEIIKSEIP